MGRHLGGYRHQHKAEGLPLHSPYSPPHLFKKTTHFQILGLIQALQQRCQIGRVVLRARVTEGETEAQVSHGCVQGTELTHGHAGLSEALPTTLLGSLKGWRALSKLLLTLYSASCLGGEPCWQL